MQFEGIVRTSAGGKPDGLVDGCRQHETAVVVGMLADEVDAAGCANGGLRRSAINFLEKMGDGQLVGLVGCWHKKGGFVGLVAACDCSNKSANIIGLNIIYVFIKIARFPQTKQIGFFRGKKSLILPVLPAYRAR